MFKKIFISTLISILSIVTVLPTASAVMVYYGQNGEIYFDSDFEMTTTPVIYAETMYQGWGRFCIEPPTQYYEGFAFYSTVGDFTGTFTGDSTGDYTPQYMSKNTVCFVHPEKFTTDTKISVKIYPYIALKDNANKFIQPGYTASATFKAQDGNISDPLTLTGTGSYKHNNIDWDESIQSKLGTDFDYYRLYYAKGSYSTMPNTAGYWDVTTSFYNDHKNLTGGDWWSYQVVPVKLKNGAYIEVAKRSNVIQLKVTGDVSVKLETPTITYPESDTTFTNLPRKAYIQWTPVTGATFYEVHLDRYASPWYDYNTYESTNAYYTTPALTLDGDYRVRIRALNSDVSGATWSDWSSYALFKYDTSGYDTLSAPTITAPNNNATLTNYPRKAYLSWTSVSNAKSYEIDMEWLKGSWTDYALYTSTSTAFTTPALSGNNQFRFRVSAINNNGKNGTWSYYTYFNYSATSTGELNLYVESWKDGMPKIGWGKYSGTFDGYALFVTKGVVDENEATMADPTYFSKTKNTYQLTKMYSNTQYTIRVLPYKNKGTGIEYIYPGTGILTIETGDTSGTDTTQLPAPEIVSPDNNEVLTNYPRKAYIQWKPVSGAAKYKIEIACDVCSSSTTKWLNPSTYTTTNTFYFTPALAGDNQFRLTVAAVDSEGKTGNWAGYQYFSYKTSATNQGELSLSIISWENGLPKIQWEAYDSSFDGYAMFVSQGTVGENEVTGVTPSYFSKTKVSHQMTKMYTNTNYTVRILPYKNADKALVYPGTGILHFTTGDSSGYNILPPAGYENDVLTNFDLYENPFSDTNLNTLEGRAAAELYRRGIIGGYEDGEFKGYREVNRAEIAKFLLLARYGSVADVKNNGKFKDVKDGEWYTKFVVTAYLEGIIGGYADGTFKPGEPVNTVEFLKMLNLTFKLQLNLPYSFKDVKSSDWFSEYVGIVGKYNLFPNKTNYLSPGASLTRNEIAVAIYQYLKNK